MPNETKAMLPNNEQPATTAELMAKKIAEAIKVTGVRPIDIARACGKSKQAVTGWIKTGRIDKMHLPKLAELTNLPLEWWLGTNQPTSDTPLPYSAPALARLQEIGKTLSESDWQTLIQVATQLASKHTATAEATPTAPRVAAPPSPALKQLFKRKAAVKTADFAAKPNAVTPSDEPPSRALQTQTGHK